MKQLFCTLLIGLLFFTSCQNKDRASTTPKKPKAESKYYYVEFIDNENSVLSQKTIAYVKDILFGKGYVPDNDWHIKEVGINEKTEPNNLDEFNQTTHKFKDFSEYRSSEKDAEKIVITINKPIKDTLRNFNFRSYKKRGHPEWQSVFNPGNFRFNEQKNYTEKEFGNWIANHMVVLTFK